METWKWSKSEKISNSAKPNFKQRILWWAKQNRNRGLITKIPAAAPVWLSVLTDLCVITLKMAPDSCCIGVSEILRRFASYRRCSLTPDVQVGDLPLALYTHLQGTKKEGKTAVKMLSIYSQITLLWSRYLPFPHCTMTEEGSAL